MRLYSGAYGRTIRVFHRGPCARLAPLWWGTPPPMRPTIVARSPQALPSAGSRAACSSVVNQHAQCSADERHGSSVRWRLKLCSRLSADGHKPKLGPASVPPQLTIPADGLPFLAESRRVHTGRSFPNGRLSRTSEKQSAPQARSDESRQGHDTAQRAVCAVVASWLRGVLKGEGAAETTAPKCT